MNFLLRRIKMLEKRKRLIILSIIILTLFLFLVVIYKNKQNNKTLQIDNQTYYEVILKPNNYFEKNKIDANNYYIASSIKSINVYFNYFLKNNEILNYTYEITATLKSYTDNGTKLIWTKDFNIKKINNLKQKEINIKENYNLDYEYYVNYVKSFQEYYNIKTESYLDVKLNIKINDEYNPYVILTIPINENIVEISMKEDNDFLEDNTKNSNFNKILIFIFIIIVIALFLNKILFNTDNEEKIIKEYQDIIITIQNKPHIINNNIIYLKNLRDLINIAINNNLNIFNYQNNYYTIIDNTYYIYISSS